MEAHERDVRGILRTSGCMDAKGRLRAWRRDLWGCLEAAAHDSLDGEKCVCCRIADSLLQ